MPAPDQPQFDHERLDVYQLSVQFTAFAMSLVRNLNGEYRNTRDQIIRASQSIPLNIAEGNGKRSGGDRRRFFEIARGSAMECAACLDVLVATGACTPDQITKGKALLVRIVAMLSRMTEVSNIREESVPYGVSAVQTSDYDYDYEDDYEHEHENRG